MASLSHLSNLSVKLGKLAELSRYVKLQKKISRVCLNHSIKTLSDLTDRENSGLDDRYLIEVMRLRNKITSSNKFFIQDLVWFNG